MNVKQQRTDEERKEALEKTIMIVGKLLENIAEFYDVLGLEGLRSIVDPSLEDLLKIITLFENKANDFLDSSQSSEQEDFIEINEIFNLKQGLLFARGLLISAKEKNSENCEKYRNML